MEERDRDDGGRKLTLVLPDNVGFKAMDEATKLTVQARARRDTTYGDSLMLWMSQQTDLVAPWWSRRRDSDLRIAARRCDFFMGAVYTLASKLAALPCRIEPRDSSIRGHWRQAEEFEGKLFEASEFGNGWNDLVVKWLVGRWTQDNGGFFEIIGAGRPDGPIKGPAVGIAVLDPWRCTRTGNPEFPVVYTSLDSKQYKLHYTRVAHSSQLPSDIEEMNSVGFCWMSRCLQVCQCLVDVMWYKQEKMGSRPLRAILLARGFGNTMAIENAVQMANAAADAVGLSKVSKIPVVATREKDAGLDLIGFSQLPDGFDYEKDVTLAMYAIALAGGFPPRWIWPATQTGATKADAMYQHLAGSQSGPALELRTLADLIGGRERGYRGAMGRFLPAHLKIVYDLQDDEQDMMAAQIAQTRSSARASDLMNQVVDVRTVRQKMLADGELTEPQFEDLELQDGRLEDGGDVLDLLYTGNEYLEGVTRASSLADVEAAADKAQEAYVTATSGDAKRSAHQALACLSKLASLKRKAQPGTVAAPTGETLAEEVPAEVTPTGEKQVEVTEPITPRGKPLPAWPKKRRILTPEAIAQAVREWDKRVPAGGRGLLRAQAGRSKE